MRRKEERMIITFHTTAEAMAAEKEFKCTGIEGRLIPVPRLISTGCGLAWSAPVEVKAEMEQCLEFHGLTWERIGQYLI